MKRLVFLFLVLETHRALEDFNAERRKQAKEKAETALSIQSEAEAGRRLT